MERLRIAARNHLSDSLHVATGCLQQSAQILFSLSHHAAGFQPKKRRILLAESQEARSQLFQGGWDMAFLLPATVFSGEA